jgi:hypothetical protein
MDIIDFQERLSAMLAADAAYAKRMGRIGPLQDVLARIIRKMRDLGASDSEVAGATPRRRRAGGSRWVT